MAKHQTLKSLVHHVGHEEPLNEFNMRKKIALNIRINNPESIAYWKAQVFCLFSQILILNTGSTYSTYWLITPLDIHHLVCKMG